MVVVFGVGVLVLMVFFGGILCNVQVWMKQVLSFEFGFCQNLMVLFGYFGESLVQLLLVLWLLVVVCLLVSFLLLVVMGGLCWFNKFLMFDVKWFSLMVGMKCLYGFEVIVEFIKLLLCIVFVGMVVGLVVWGGIQLLCVLFYQLLEVVMVYGFGFILKLMLVIGGVMLLFVVIDVLYQCWNWMCKLKMIWEELCWEMKESEGSFEVKGCICQLQQQMFN